MATKKSSESATQVRIGISESNQELNFETEISRDEVQGLVAKALETQQSLILHDIKERTIIVPVGKISFVELGATPDRKVGFTTL
jgi:hypothetical protein